MTELEYINFDSLLPTVTINKSGPRVDLMHFIQLESPRLRKITKRSYLKVQELFAKIGGLVNFMIIFINIITSHYFRFKYLFHIYEQISEGNKNATIKDFNININQSSSNLKANEVVRQQEQGGDVIVPIKLSNLSKFNNKEPSYLSKRSEVGENSDERNSYYDYLKGYLCCNSETRLAHNFIHKLSVSTLSLKTYLRAVRYKIVLDQSLEEEPKLEEN